MANRYTRGYELHSSNIKTKIGQKDMDINVAGAGVIPTAQHGTVSVVEKGDGVFHQTVFTFADVPITMRDTEQGAGIQIYTFPLGRILFLGGSGQITTTTTSILANTLNTGVTCNWGVGTTTQASATLATTEQDFIQVAAWVASATINVAPAASTAGVGIASVTPYAGVSTATAVFLNLAVAGAADIDADASTTTDGTVTLTWINLGTL